MVLATFFAYFGIRLATAAVAAFAVVLTALSASTPAAPGSVQNLSHI
jgi:hypothetical protein